VLVRLDHRIDRRVLTNVLDDDDVVGCVLAVNPWVNVDDDDFVVVVALVVVPFVVVPSVVVVVVVVVVAAAFAREMLD
jgi:hypothetical protein